MAQTITVTTRLLKERADRAAASGYPKSKWIEFCEAMLELGFYLRLYEARSTYSKYIYVCRRGDSYKVRFSNHKPNPEKELGGDAHFFVGMTHTGTRTTADTVAAVKEHFGIS